MPRTSSLLLIAAMVLLAGCTRPPAPPNVLWIVWDTVRADHLGLYGYRRPTTPHLETWARRARVFDNCVSPGTITLTSHGSFLTGLPSSEHGADNGRKWLDEGHVTLAEHLKAMGYRTFLWSANPHISAEANFDQGFDVYQHPWDDTYRRRAKQIVLDKVAPGDRSSELSYRLGKEGVFDWDVKATGVLAREALADWLGGDDDPAPYFAFLNYMEAHRPRIPPPDFRARMMSPADVEQSYEIDQSWDTIWGYSFKLSEYTEDELRIMIAMYDAAIAELDELLRDLLKFLETEGQLENTVVVLTSDHGEHLGEHHLLDHQYSVYEPLARVPLVLYHPTLIPPGRDSRPVMSHDVFATLLELCGVGAGTDALPAVTPKGGTRNFARSASLLQPRAERPRLTEYLTPFRTAFKSVAKRQPDWDPAPWNVKLRALTHGRYKLIRGSRGRVELYDLDADPTESQDLAAAGHPEVARLSDLLDRQLAALKPWKNSGVEPPQLSPEHRRRLQALGYLGSSEAEEPLPPVPENLR